MALSLLVPRTHCQFQLVPPIHSQSQLEHHHRDSLKLYNAIIFSNKWQYPDWAYQSFPEYQLHPPCPSWHPWWPWMYCLMYHRPQYPLVSRCISCHIRQWRPGCQIQDTWSRSHKYRSSYHSLLLHLHNNPERVLIK